MYRFKVKLVGKIIYHTLDDVARHVKYVDFLLDKVWGGPDLPGYEWRDNWKPKDKKGPNSALFHIINKIAKKSDLVEETLNMVSPKIEGCSWRYYWEDEDT